MKIALIKPTIGTKMQKLYTDEGRMEPLQLGVIAAMLPKDIEVVLYDDRMEKIPYNEPADIVMITVEAYTAKRAYEIAQEYKKRGVRVIMGGIHAKLCSKEVAQHCDTMIMGDMETVIADLLNDIKSGNLKPLYEGGIADPPQEDIITRRDLYKGKGYLPLSLLQFSRGCVHNCNYCAVSKYFNRGHYCRRVEAVIEEIKTQNKRYLFFVDDNIIANKEKAKELFRALIPLKIKWVSQGSVDMLYDDELMELIVASGGQAFVMGFESINEVSLDYMGKNVNKLRGFDKYKWEVERLRYWGLQTWAAFTLGHDGDTLDSIKATLDFALENKFTYAAFNILMPYYGTPLYKKLEAENRLLYDGKWWLHDDYRFNSAAFIPKNMTPDELTDACMYCRGEFNRPSSIIKRAFEPHTNMASLERLLIYSMGAPLFRKEVYKKHGMLFGLKQFFNRGKNDY